MRRSVAFLVAIAVVAAGAGAQSGAQAVDAAQAPAPIVRAYGGQPGAGGADAATNGAAASGTTSTHPIPGVTVRVAAGTAVETVSANSKVTELRLTHGIANVSVRYPGKKVRILVDLPGGQTSILRDGLYTFNADTNMVRVLKGEADAYPGAAVDGIRVAENHELAFGAGGKGNAVVASSREELMTDYLAPGVSGGQTRGDGYAGGYGPYGDGYYGYPAYGYYGYPYGWGYPYGYGIGFGYFGGFRGGFRGRFR
jgi:hypothetical protein